MTRKQTASQTAVMVVAMGLVAVAAAVALHRHAGLPQPVAATAAFAAYLLLLSVHAVMWRTARRAVGTYEGRTPDARRPAGNARQQVPPPAPTLGPAPALATARGPRPTPPLSTLTPPGSAPAAPRTAPPPLPPSTARAAAPREADGPVLPQPGAPRAERASPPPLSSAPRFDAATRGPAQDRASPQNRASAQGAGEDMQDYWSFRPSVQGHELPPFVTGRVPAPQPGAPQANAPQAGAPPQPASAPAKATPPPIPQQASVPPQAPRSGAPREADVEVIQDAIKRLLEEVNAAEQQQERNGHARPHRPPTISAPAAGKAPPSAATESAIDRSIEALRMTAGSMRTAFGQRDGAPAAAQPRQAPPPLPPQQAQPQPQQTPPQPVPPFVRGATQSRPVHPADARARLMADAISAGRIDVSLEPILGLEDQQTRHYEVSVRLRDADGNPLEITADGPDLRGTGLLPLFDGVRIARTAAVAGRLEERGKVGSVFSAFSGESVADEHFLGELAETLHQRSGLVAQLVLSFTQSDVRAFSTPEWDSLADMRALGFRFAISALTDLDMDFEALAEQGFAFVKLDASVFLEGLPAPSGRLPSSDVCRHLAKHGLTLVVEHIDDDEKLARVFGFGVLLGQGQLFGGARPVRADVSSGRRSTTAAA